MGFYPPPPPLTPQQFEAAMKRCSREGLPPTIENIDPELFKWRQARRRTFNIQAGILLGVVLLGLVASIVVPVLAS